VGLHLAQDAGQALKRPHRIRLIGADRVGASLDQLAETRRSGTQLTHLLQVPGQVADGPESGRMIGAQDLLPAVEQLLIEIVGALVVSRPAYRVGQPRHGVERGDVLRPLESGQLVEDRPIRGGRLLGLAQPKQQPAVLGHRPDRLRGIGAVGGNR
jgi:hypothetical protein